jgi:hypothetical protein
VAAPSRNRQVRLRPEYAPWYPTHFGVHLAARLVNML